MGRKKKGKKTATEDSKYSVKQLLEKVHEYVDTFEFELAQKFCDRALSIEEDHAGALELAGSIKAEQGDLDTAKEYLLKAVNAEPNDGYSKYMYLGQISQGLPAVEFYLKGIQLMKNDLEKQNSSGSSSTADTTSGIENQISNAYCSLAEIYLTDSCFEENAEDLCRMYCEEALKHDSQNPDAYLVMCNYLLSKGENEKAKSLIVNNFNLWNIPCIDESENGMLDADASATVHKPTVSYTTRIGLARLLFELNITDKTELVLGNLLTENDEDIEVWYLLALVSQSTGDLVNMKMYLLQLQELYEKLQLDTENDEVYSHVCELLKSCENVTVNEEVSEDDTEMIDDS